MGKRGSRGPSDRNPNGDALSELITCAITSTDADQVLRRAAEITAAALPLGRVLVFGCNASNLDQCPCASIGWDASTSTQILKRLGAWLLDNHSEHDRPAGYIEERIDKQGNTPISSILREQGIATGLVILIASRSNWYGVIAESGTDPMPLRPADFQLLRALASILGLFVDRVFLEQQRDRNHDMVARAKRQWEATVDTLPVLVCVLDKQARVVRVNRTLETWRLGGVRSARGGDVHSLLHPECSDWDCPLRTRSEQMIKELERAESAEREMYDQVLDSDLRLSVRRAHKADASGGHDEYGYAILIVEDVSDRKHAARILETYNEELQERLREGTLELIKANAQLKEEVEDHVRDKEAFRELHERYACLVENTLTGIYVAYHDDVVFCNGRFCDMFGYGREELYDLSLGSLFEVGGGEANPPGPSERAERMGRTRIVRGTRKDGETIWLRQCEAETDCHGERMVLGNVIDITRQQSTETSLHRSKQQLRELSAQLLSAQEEERKRIASELHDGIGQSMSAAKLGIENTLRDVSEGLSEGQSRKLEGVVERIRDTIEEVRSISMALRPSMLDDLGLIATLAWFCREYESLYSGIELTKTIELAEDEVPEHLKIVVFRIVQEALNNVAKHARARAVTMLLTRAEDRLRLSIHDDGEGFVADERLRKPGGFGLSSMKERARLSGGELTLQSGPGAGTRIDATWSAIE